MREGEGTDQHGAKPQEDASRTKSCSSADSLWSLNSALNQPRLLTQGVHHMLAAAQEAHCSHTGGRAPSSLSLARNFAVGYILVNDFDLNLKKRVLQILT